VDEAPFELGEQSSEIINGSTDLSKNPYEQLRTVFVSIKDLGSCSGTLLRENMVLTAKHCIMSNGLPVGNPVAVDRITVNGIKATGMYVGDSEVDAAVVMFASGLVGTQWESFTAIDPFASTRYLGQSLKMTGFGKDENGAAGTLKIASATVQRVNAPYSALVGSQIGTFVSNPSTGSAGGKGDSGGPLWGPATIPPTVVGAFSAGAGLPFGDSVFAQAANFRYQFRYWIHDRTNASLSVSFNSITDLTNNFLALQADTSGTLANWTVQGGALIQQANARQSFQIQKGIFENLFVQMFVQSGDDDTVGIAFRYVDKNNHYRCEVNRAEHVLRIVRRRLGGETVIASTPWNGQLINDVLGVFAIENEYECGFGDTVVSSTNLALNAAFPAGRVAIYDDFNQGARILWYKSLQLPPSDATW
jgi:hypothetical protein